MKNDRVSAMDRFTARLQVSTASERSRVVEGLRVVFFLLVGACATDSYSDVMVSPPNPKAQETVRVTIPEGLWPYSNTYPGYDDRAMRVSMVANKIVVSLQVKGDVIIPPGARRFDVPLGQFPAGSYDVEVGRRMPDGTALDVLGTASFSVAPRNPTDPVWNNTDLWWDPTESGWGLNVVQHGNGKIFATWFVYGPDRKPIWYSIPDGKWTSPTEYRGPIYRTTGPDIAGCSFPSCGTPFDPLQVTRTEVGTATMGFDSSNYNVGGAVFVIDGVTIVKHLRRLDF